VSDDDLEMTIGVVNDAITAGDPRSVADLLDPDVVWEHNLGAGTPEEGVYRGRESVIQLLERVVETWEYLRPEPRSIDRLDEGVYLVRGDLHAKHRASDMEIGASYEQQLEFRDHKLVKGWMKVAS